MSSVHGSPRNTARTRSTCRALHPVRRHFQPVIRPRSRAAAFFSVFGPAFRLLPCCLCTYGRRGLVAQDVRSFSFTAVGSAATRNQHKTRYAPVEPRRVGGRYIETPEFFRSRCCRIPGSAGPARERVDDSDSRKIWDSRVARTYSFRPRASAFRYTPLAYAQPGVQRGHASPQSGATVRKSQC